MSKMRKNALIIAISTLAVLTVWRGVPAQSQSKCSQITYSTPNVNAQSYRLARIEGQAVYASPSQKWELGSVKGLCVTLFSRRSKLHVASVTTDDKGQFEFVDVPPAEYVLAAFAGDLQKVIIPIQLVPARKAGKPQRLLLHLREKDDERKSYVTPVTHLALRRELLAMIERDQKIRNEMIQSGVDHPNKEILARMDVIDRRNTLRMKSIIKENGWPGPALVGWDGTEAAFVLVQHSDHRTQKEFVLLIQEEYRKGNLSGPNYALFTDRVLVEDGKPQLYGSRPKPFDQWNGGEPVFYPIEDEPNVDRRRAEVGLSTLAEYREFLKQMYHPRSK
jgi:hypothetical protein